jgi:hypothetical protein
MTTISKADQILRIISQAWGPEDNTGYCFFPWVEGPDRKFRSKSFQWPQQRDDILQHMLAHEGDDLYWCPLLFAQDARQVQYATEEYALWADLDEADPRKIDPKWKPSIAWETSPGRYQALWLLNDPDEEDLYGASQKGADNQRMTRLVDADPSGWDTTQLLRLPGWTNHKSQYEDENGEFPQGKLLWSKGPRYNAEQFNELPAIDDEGEELPLDAELFEKIDGVEPGEVLDRVRLLLPKSVPERMERGPQEGEDRSKPMFYFMRCLADVGCSIQEIVAVIRPTPWNKFRGRKTELEDLAEQAKTAWTKRKKQFSETVDYTGLNVNDFIAAAKPPKWLVRNMIVRGNVGFIGGEPKARKSWVALDLAMSVAGSASAHHMHFLDQFAVEQSGPVLYFVLEDSPHLMSDRIKKVWEAKTKYDGTQLILHEGGVYSEPRGSRIEAPLTLVHGHQVNFSDKDSMAKVQQRIRQGYTMANGKKWAYALVIFDTFMRSVGGSDINHMGEMMNIVLDPLTRMAKRENTTILLVHHFNKSRVEGEIRGGTRLLGSQALHAWAEDSLYLTAREHGFIMELESKAAPSGRWDFKTDPTQRTWAPTYTLDAGAQVHDIDFSTVERPKPRRGSNTPKLSGNSAKVWRACLRLQPEGPQRCSDISRAAGLSPAATYNCLRKLQEIGRAAQTPDKLWTVHAKPDPVN